jgi:hypothetical protein
MNAYAQTDTYFEKRSKALLDTLAEMETRYGDFPDEPQLPTLYATTTRLKEFAIGILDFFYKGFTSGKLLSSGYPPKNVYAALLNQIAYDIEVIQRAADQRVTTGFAVMKQRLKEADNLAWQVLQNSVGDGKPLERGTTVVTYFQKSPMVRVIPYANVALIGIPFTCVDEPRDLLATPHEVGHYFFWRACDVVPRPETPPKGEAYYFYRTVIKKALDELKALITVGHTDFDNWCHAWLEELFADVYGAWAAGPVSVLTQQDNQANRAVSEFVESDGEHPAPVLRPYASWKALSKRAADPTILNLLKSHWNGVLIDYKDPKTFKRPDGPDLTVEQAVEKDTALKADKPVDVLVNYLIKRLQDYSLPPGDWRKGSTAPTTTEELYAQFEDFRQDNLSRLQVISQPAANLSGSPDFKTWAKERFTNSPALAALIDDPNYPVESPILETEWLPIMQARGWTIEGPQNFWP